MRRDLIIGLLCSILLHGGLAWGGNLNFNFGKKKKVAHEEIPTIELAPLPPVEPEPPENPEDSGGAGENAAIAPPSLADVPSSVSVDTIVQAVQPPPPPTAKISNVAPKTGAPPTGGMREVFDLKNLDQQPVQRNQLRPQYPFEMKRLGVTGEVLLEFVCDTEGNVRNVRVLKSTRTEFESAAIEAVSRLKFRPGRKGGRAVNARIQQPIVFSITDDE